MSFYRVTTPTHTYNLPMDTSTLSVIQVTYKQGAVSIVKQYQGSLPRGMSLDGKKVIITLTQQETKEFKAVPVKSQVRVLTNVGKALASQKFTINVEDVLNEEVLFNG